MVDELEEKPGERLDLQQYIGVIRRRYLLFLIPFFLGWLAFWSASWVLPVRYTWGTEIRVPTAHAPNVPDDPQGRLEKVIQHIQSSTPLLHIVDRLNLYPKDRGRLTPDELVERMRNDIKIEKVRGDEPQITSVNIYYSAHDPYVARQVTGELTSLFISEDERMRIQEYEDKIKSLEYELVTSHQNLVEQEEKVRVFEEQHPELGRTFQILAGLRSELQKQEDALHTAQQQNATLREPPVGPKSGDGSPIRLALEQELNKLEAQRDDLISRGYTERHPDVRKLTEQIAQKRKSLAEPTAGKPPDVDSGYASAIIQHQRELKANQVEMASREREIAELNAKINHYQELLNQEPALQQQLTDLRLGYDQLKAHYDDLLNKKAASDMALDLLKRHQGDLPRTIDLTRLPLKPDFPNRIKLWGIGLGVGLALGTFLTTGAEYLDDRIHDEKALSESLAVPVLSEIPRITTQADKRRQQRRLWLTWVLTGFVFATILTGSVVSFLWG